MVSQNNVSVYPYVLYIDLLLLPKRLVVFLIDGLGSGVDLISDLVTVLFRIFEGYFEDHISGRFT